MAGKNDLEVKIAVSLDTASIQSQLAELESRLSKLETTIKVNTDTTEAEEKVKTLGEKIDENLEKAGSKLESVGSKMSSLGNGLTGMFGGVTSFAKDCIETFMEFDLVMANIKATAGLTEEQLQKLSTLAGQLATTTKYSNTEVAESMLALAKGGMSVEQIYGAIPSVLNLATVGNIDLADSADYTTKILNSFGLASEDTATMVQNAARVTDVLAQAANNSTLDVAELATYLGNCSGTGELLGYTIEDVCSVLMVLSDNGLQAGKATIALRNIMMTMAGGELKLCAQGMEDVVIKTQNADGTMKSLQDILLECNGAFGTMTDAQQIQAATSLVGKTNAEAFVKAVNNANGKLQENTQILNDCSGAAQEYNDTIMDTPSGKIEELNSAFTNFKKAVGEGLIPILTPFLNILSKVITVLGKMDPKVVAAVVALGTFLGIVGKVVTGLGNFIFSLGMVLKGLTGIGKVIGLLVSFIGIKGAIVIGVIAGIGFAIYEAIKHWDELKTAIQNFGTWVKGKFDGFVSEIKEKFQKFLGELQKIWDSLVDIFDWGDINTDIGTFVGDIIKQWQECFNWIGNVFDRFKDGFSWDKVKQTTSEFLDGIGINFEGTFTNIKNAFKIVEDVFHMEGLTDAVANTAKQIGEVFTKNLDFEGAKEKFSYVFKQMSSGWKESFNWMGNVFDRFKDGFSWDKVEQTTTELFDGFQINVSKTFDNLEATVGALGDLTGTQDLAKGIINGLASVQDFTGVWLEDLQQRWEESFNWIGNVFDRFKDGFSWDKVKQTTSEFLDGIGINFEGTFSTIKESLNAGGWNLGWEHLGDSLFRPLEDIKGQWGECLEWLGNKKDAFEDGITWDKIKTTAKEAFEGVDFNTEALDKTIEDTKLSLSEIFQTDKIQEKWNGFKEWLGNLDIKQTIVDKWNGIKEWASNLDIVKWASDKWSGLKEWFGSLSIVQAVSSTWNGFKEWLDGISIVQTISTKWDEFKEWLGSLSIVQAVSSTWNEFKEWLGGIIETITKPFKDFAEGVQKTFTDIGNFFKEIIEPWVEPFQKFFEKIGKIFDSIKESISLKTNEAWQNVKDTWQGVKDWFGENVSEPIKQKFNDTWEGIKQTFEPLIKWFNDTWTQIKEGFSNSWNVIADIAGQVWDKIKSVFNEVSGWFTENVINPVKDGWDAITTKFNETWEGIKQTFEPLIQWFNDTWTQISEGFSKAGDVIKDVAGAIWEGIKSPFVSAGTWWEENVASPIKEGWNGAKEYIGKKWTEWKEGFTKDNEEAASNFGEWVDNMPDDWQGCVDYIGQAWNEKMEGVKNKISETKQDIINKWEEVKTGVSNKVQELKTAIVNKWEEVKTGVSEKANNIKTSVSEAFHKIIDPVKEVIKNVKDFIGKLGEIKVPNPIELIKSGFNGIRDAIKSAKEWLDQFNLTNVKDKVVNVTKNIFSSSAEEPVQQALEPQAEDEMEVNTTKTVLSMQEIGGNIGLTSMLNMGNTGQALNNLTDALTGLGSNIATMNSLLSKMENSSNSTGNPTNVTFNNTITQNTSKETDIDELLENVEARQKYQLRKLGIFDK